LIVVGHGEPLSTYGKLYLWTNARQPQTVNHIVESSPVWWPFTKTLYYR